MSPQVSRKAEDGSAREGPRREKLRLACPGCRKEYLIDPAHLRGKAKARFRCRTCGLIFEKAFGPQLREPEAELPPAPARNIAAQPAAVFLAVFLLAAALIPLTLQREHVLPLSITRSSVSSPPDGPQGVLTFTGTVANSTGRGVGDAHLEVALFDQAGSFLAVHRIRLMPQRSAEPSVTLAPDESIDFSLPVRLIGEKIPASYSVRASGKSVSKHSAPL